MALIRMCVVPNCSQRPSRPVLWIVTVCATYTGHTVLLIHVICDITVAVKKVTQNPAVLNPL